MQKLKRFFINRKIIYNKKYLILFFIAFEATLFDILLYFKVILSISNVWWEWLYTTWRFIFLYITKLWFNLAIRSFWNRFLFLFFRCCWFDLIILPVNRNEIFSFNHIDSDSLCGFFDVSEFFTGFLWTESGIIGITKPRLSKFIIRDNLNHITTFFKAFKQIVRFHRVRELDINLIFRYFLSDLRLICQFSINSYKWITINF